VKNSFHRRRLQGRYSAIGRVRPSVSTVVFLDQLTFDIIHVYSSLPAIESQGHRSRSLVRLSKDGNAVGLISILDRGQFVFQSSTSDWRTNVTCHGGIASGSQLAGRQSPGRPPSHSRNASDITRSTGVTTCARQTTTIGPPISPRPLPGRPGRSGEPGGGRSVGRSAAVSATAGGRSPQNLLGLACSVSPNICSPDICPPVWVYSYRVRGFWLGY